MDDIIWTPVIKLYPMQLNNFRQAFDIYLKKKLNKYIASFKGVLLNVDKGSLKLVPSIYSHQSINKSCLAYIYPDLPYVSLKAEVVATVFCPTVGQRLETMVCSVKRFFVVCKYGTDFSVCITIPVSEQDNHAYYNFSNLKLSFGDRVEVEITKVIRASSEMILHGKICRIIEFSKQISMDADTTFYEPKTELSDGDFDVDLQPIKKGKRIKRLKEKTLLVTKPECTPTTLDIVDNHKKMKLNLDLHLQNETGYEFASAIKEEPVDDISMKYQHSEETVLESFVSPNQDFRSGTCENLFPPSHYSSSSFIKSEPNSFPIVHKKQKKKYS